MVSAIFGITLVIGLGLIAIAFIQPEFIFNDGFAPLSIESLTGLTLIDVPIDPTGGQILGTVKFGAPIIVPFERSGTIISPDGQPCETALPSGIRDREIKFGRIGSGDRNAEVSWHNFNGINCAYGYAEWDLTDLPNDFVATGVRFQFFLKEVPPLAKSDNAGSHMVYLGNTVDEIGVENIPNRIVFGCDDGTIGANGAKVIFSGSKGSCPENGDFLAYGGGAFIGGISQAKIFQTAGVKSFTFGEVTSGSTFDVQKGVDTFNMALQFNPLTQLGTDKFTLGFTSTGGSTISGKYVIDHQWWEENGSLLVTGASQPIRCGIGFNQVDFRCVPIVCAFDEQLNQNTNECETIICPAGETLEIITEEVGCILGFGIGEEPDPCNPIQRAICTPTTIVCESGTQLIGSTCEPLFCGEGFEISGNECVLKTCGIGKELRGDTCETIICPINTRLIGNDCVEISCPAGQISIDNVCNDSPPIECDAGFKQVGDGCLPIDLDCPFGTEEFENTCVNRIPSLLQISGVNPTLFLIVGLVIVGMTGVGIVARRNA